MLPYRYQNPISDQSIKLQLHLLRQRPARDQHSKLHVDAESVFRQVRTGQEQAAAIGHGTFDVQGADFAALGHRPLLFRPVVDRRTRPYVGPEGLDSVVFALPLDAIGRFHDDVNLHAATGGADKGLPNMRNPVDRVP